MEGAVPTGRVKEGPAKSKKKGWWKSLSPEAKIGIGLGAAAIPIGGAAAYYAHKKGFRFDTGGDYYQSARDSYRRAAGAGGGARSARSGWSTPSGHVRAHSVMPELKNVKTKVEAKKVYRDYVSRSHPDRATSPAQRAEFEEKMKNINPAWQDFQNSEFFTKLSHVGYWQMVAEYLVRNRSAEEA